MLHPPCLILNQDYTALTIIGWKRAICQQIIGKEMIGEGIRALEYYKDKYILSTGGDQYPVMAVAVTNRYIKMHRIVPLCKKNLLLRDNSTCQYCNTEVRGRNGTVDHVVPRSHFKNKNDSNTWDNLVISCHQCNNKKGSRTPKQAGMKLLREPKIPSYSNIFFINIKKTYKIPEEWKMYI